MSTREPRRIPHPWITIGGVLGIMAFTFSVFYFAVSSLQRYIDSESWLLVPMNISLFLFFILFIVSWVAALITTARIWRWGWFTSIFFLSPISLLLFGLRGPKEEYPVPDQPGPVISVFNLGHLIHTETRKNPSVYVRESRTDSYQTQPILIPRPPIGTAIVTVTCPFCGAVVSIKVASVRDCRKGQVKRLVLAFLIIGGLSFLVPWFFLIALLVTLFNIWMLCTRVSDIEKVNITGGQGAVSTPGLLANPSIHALLRSKNR